MNFSLKDNRIILCGKTNSGKSVLLKHMLKKEKHKFHKIFVISPTEQVLKFYSDIVPPNQIIHEYSDEWITDLLKKLTAHKKNDDKKFNVLLILDDVGADAHNSKALNKVFTMGRHLGISIIITSQFINQLPLTSRTNASFVCCSQMNKASIDILVDEYLMGPIEKKEFIKMYHDSTRDFNFFVICCNSVKDNEDLDQLYGTIRAN